MQVQAAVGGKPEYHMLTATVALIDPQQAFYYQANPATNKKVRQCHVRRSQNSPLLDVWGMEQGDQESPSLITEPALSLTRRALADEEPCPQP